MDIISSNTECIMDVPCKTYKIFNYKEDDWQGMYMVIYKLNGNYIWKYGSFNSCCEYDDNPLEETNKNLFNICDNLMDVLIDEDHKFLDKEMKKAFYKFILKQDLDIKEYLNRNTIITENANEKRKIANENIRIENEKKEILIKQQKTEELVIDTIEVLEYIKNKQNDEFYNDRINSMKKRLKFNLEHIIDEYAIIKFSDWCNIKDSALFILNQ